MATGGAATTKPSEYHGTKWCSEKESNSDLGRFNVGLNALREVVKWSAV